jgi:hypothetical protein
VFNVDKIGLFLKKMLRRMYLTKDKFILPGHKPEVDVNKAWEAIRENIKISAKESLDYYELKKHKP